VKVRTARPGTARGPLKGRDLEALVVRSHVQCHPVHFRPSITMRRYPRPVAQDVAFDGLVYDPSSTFMIRPTKEDLGFRGGTSTLWSILKHLG
jgi:hypothetical protein